MDKDLFDDEIIGMTADEAYDFLSGMGGHGSASYSYIDELRKNAAEDGIDDPVDDSLFPMMMGIDDEGDLWGNE